MKKKRGGCVANPYEVIISGETPKGPWPKKKKKRRKKQKAVTGAKTKTG